MTASQHEVPAFGNYLNFNIKKALLPFYFVILIRQEFNNISVK